MRHERIEVGIVEDDPIMGESLLQRLELEGFSARWWRTKAEALAAIQQHEPLAVLCDIRLPDGTGEDLYREVAAGEHAPSFLFMTAFGDIDVAVRLMRAGASDYVTKPFDLEAMLGRIERLVERALATEQALGKSPAIQRIERLLRRVAGIDSTVLLIGPSGSGKEVAAKLLHRLGPSARRPFVPVNCAAIPRDLLESELFGHEKGSFTGAGGRHIGLAEHAADGVLFLDEIGELPLGLQPKLLRLLQERRFRRVGGTAEIEFRGRVLAATNVDLRERVRSGVFREDLFYRLSVITVDMPRLRDRAEDIAPLAEGFLREFAHRFDRELRGFSHSGLEALQGHDWPGNIRELANRVERAVALAQGPLVAASDLFPERDAPSREKEFPSLAEVRELAEKRAILSALEATGGQVTAAARRLGVSRSTLFEKIRRFEVVVPPEA